MESPSPNGSNGRGPGGRFAPGNSGGPGNPHAQQVAKWRSTVMAAVTEADLRQVFAKLVEMAKDGNMPAIKELLDRVVGKPLTTIEIDANDETIKELEMQIERLKRDAIPWHEEVKNEPEYLEFVRWKMARDCGLKA